MRSLPGLAFAATLLAGSAIVAAPACRVSVSLDPPRAVVGQQVLYRARIVSRADVASVEWTRAPAFPSLRTESLPGDPQPAVAGLEPGSRARDERRALFAERPGLHRLEAPELRCRLKSGAVETAPVPAAELAVDAPPADGRPEGFSGLVGPVAIQQTVTPRDVRLGESVRVALMLRSGGNLWELPPPYSEAAFPGSDVFARRPKQVLERGHRLQVRRHFAWDVVPRETGVLRVPGVALPYFDPRSGSYAVARSPAVEVTVRDAAPEAARAPARGNATQAAQPPRARGRAMLVSFIALAATILGVAGVLWLRRRSADPRRRGPSQRPAVREEARDEGAAAELERTLRSALARHLEDAASVTSEELIARRPGPALAAAARCLASLERARFDPEAPPPDADAVHRVIAQL